MNKLIKYSLRHALGVIVYIFAVAAFMMNANAIFGKEDTIIEVVVLLSLFTLSAAVVGSLTVGKPILMYLDGEKKDAVKLFGYTLLWLFLWLVVAGVIVAIF